MTDIQWILSMSSLCLPGPGSPSLEFICLLLLEHQFGAVHDFLTGLLSSTGVLFSVFRISFWPRAPKLKVLASAL